MTIRVTVKNEDQSRKVDVIVEDVNRDTGERHAAPFAGCLLDPGVSADFWIHQTRDLHVVELHPDDPRNSVPA